METAFYVTTILFLLDGNSFISFTQILTDCVNALLKVSVNASL